MILKTTPHRTPSFGAYFTKESAPALKELLDNSKTFNYHKDEFLYDVFKLSSFDESEKINLDKKHSEFNPELPPKLYFSTPYNGCVGLEAESCTWENFLDKLYNHLDWNKNTIPSIGVDSKRTPVEVNAQTTKDEIVDILTSKDKRITLPEKYQRKILDKLKSTIWELQASLYYSQRQEVNNKYEIENLDKALEEYSKKVSELHAENEKRRERAGKGYW